MMRGGVIVKGWYVYLLLTCQAATAFFLPGPTFIGGSRRRVDDSFSGAPRYTGPIDAAEESTVFDTMIEITTSDRHQLSSTQKEEEEVLSCKILGCYPFPTPLPEGPLGWIFRDTHQAIVVSSRRGNQTAIRVWMDFMTQGAEFHPVWYN